jgi:2-amino-4-hydroxy-6-hydroxymethyldihydropteridine diphosphokinase
MYVKYLNCAAQMYADTPKKQYVCGKKVAMQSEFSKKYINAYLCLGSNTGNTRKNFRDALALIEKKIGKVVKKSHLYETQPWGNPDQDNFLNQMVMVNTTLEPRQILEEITRIEREMGRERKEKWGPRIIDIDIVLYGKRVIRDKGLEIPHPEMHKRAFVLVPLMELAPDYEHPILHQPIDELYMSCEDESDVRRLDE